MEMFYHVLSASLDGLFKEGAGSLLPWPKLLIKCGQWSSLSSSPLRLVLAPIEGNLPGEVGAKLHTVIL
jgi:hypothetical protein